MSDGRKNIKAPQQKIPIKGTNGCHLFLKVFFLCFDRSAITPIQTITKADSVPILTISASSPRDTNPAILEIKIPEVRMTFIGV